MNKTRNWPTRAIHMLIALALVFSMLGVVAVPMASPVLASPGAVLTTNITAPAGSANVSVCGNFTLSFNITNTGDADAESVFATIFPGSKCEVVVDGVRQGGGIAWSTDILWEELAVNATASCNVTMHCLEPGKTSIRVEPRGQESGVDIPSGSLISDTVYFNQKAAAALTVGLTVPGTVSVCQNFTAEVTVTNSGEEGAADAQNVTATISVGGGAELVSGDGTWTIGTISVGSPAAHNWTIHCENTTAAEISVTASGKDALSNNDISDSAAETVTQEAKAHLEVTSVTSDLINDNTASTEQSFNITAVVHNAGGAVAQNVSAALGITGNASLISGPSPDEVASLAGCHNATFTWAVNCTGEGTVAFNVTPEGIDENTGVAVLEENIVSRSLNVTQVLKAHLTVTITTPETCTNITACFDFDVEAVVANTGNATAEGVTADLTIDVETRAHLVSSASQLLGDIAGGENATATWTLHCDAAGDVTITVTPAGTDENTGEDIPDENLDLAESVTIHQIAPVLPAPTLLTPANGATLKSHNVTFDWEDIPGVCNVTYTLVVFEKDNTSANITAGNLTASQKSLTLFNDEWGWYVVAHSAGQDATSETWYFLVDVDEMYPDVTVTRPNGGETWVGGTEETIIWEATEFSAVGDGFGLVQSDLIIDISYSSNGGGTWTSIATGEENDGAYPWTVPEINKTQCLVRVEATDDNNNTGTATSKGVFTITTGAAIPVTVEAPAGVKTGANFTVQVKITGVTDFDAADFEVVFDSSVLKAENITADITDGLIGSTTIPVVSANETSPGTLKILVNVSGTPGVTGSGYLCEIRFHAIGAADTSSTINLQNGTLSDKDGAAITAVWTGDSINVLEHALGDANGDGVLDASDLTTVERMVIGLETPTPEADINQDGAWNALDVTLIEILLLEA